MKKILLTFWLVGFASIASAAPYLVYSGSSTSSSFTSAGVAKSASTIYLATDLADSSSFAIMQVDSATKDFTVVARPTANPTDTEAPNNFFGGLVTSAKAGTGVLRFSGSSTDANGNTYVANAFGTGPLVVDSTTLVPARTKPAVVSLEVNGSHASFIYTSTSAITSGSTTFPKSISGVITSHEIAAGGGLARISESGTFTLTQNAALTSLANIGGGYTSGKNTAAILPISIPSGISAADAYAAWLSAFAQVSGYNGPTSSQSATGTLPFGTDVSPGSAVLPATLGGLTTNAVTLGGGTLNLIQSEYASVLVQPGIGTGFSGVLAIRSTAASPGGVIVVGSGAYPTTTLQHLDPANPGAVLGFTLSDALVEPPLMTGYLIGSLTDFGVSNPPLTLPTDLLSQWPYVYIGGGSMTLRSVQNGLASGTVTIPNLDAETDSGSGYGYGLTIGENSNCIFSGVSLMLHGVNIGSSLAPGDTLSGYIKVTGGTFVDQDGTNFTATGNTFTLAP